MVARRLAAASALTLAAALAALAPAAQGRTIGSTAPPTPGSRPVACFGSAATVVTQATGAAPSWTAPNGGTLTSWSLYARDVPPGSVARMVVLRGMTVAAVETGTIGALTADGVAVFTPAAPLRLQAGDRIGLVGDSVSYCYFDGGAADQTLQVLGTQEPALTPGATLQPTGPSSPGGLQLTLAAEVSEAVDLRVSAAAGPADAIAGQLAQLSATVTNIGQAPSGATVATTVPAGLSVTAAVAGGGSCAVAGQAVTCTIATLAAGASVPVVVLVTPAAAGSYPVAFSVTPSAGTVDLNPADNAVGATLAVAPAPSPTPPAATPRCVVPTLAGTPLGVARSLLAQLGCRPGSVTKARSKRIARGAVISTKPGRGEYRAGSAVALVVSSGKPVRKPSRRAARRGATRRGARRGVRH